MTVTVSSHSSLANQNHLAPAADSNAGKTRLQALSSAARLLPGLVLPGLLLPGLLPGIVASAQAADAGADGVSLQFSRYEEGKRELIDAHSQLPALNVDVVHGSINAHLQDRVRFTFGYTQDTWSGATPVTTAPLVTDPNRALLRNSAAGVVVAGASPYVNNQLLLDAERRPLRVRSGVGGVTEIDTRAVQVLSSASPESRDQADFSLAYDWDEAALEGGTGISQENDYESVYGNLSLRLDFNQKLTSVTLGGGYTRSEANAILDPDLLPYLNRAAYQQDIKRRRGSETLQGDRRDWTAMADLTQVLNRETVLNVGLGYTHSKGFLENPYKAMTVLFVDQAQLRPNGGANLPVSVPVTADMRVLLEQRPDQNRQLAFNSKLVRYVEGLDAALHLSYGYSHDDWSVSAHTLEAEWIQPLAGGWQIAPRLRYYSQSEADFYQTYLVSEQFYRRFDPDNPERPQVFDPALLPEHFSSDHRLSGFGALSAGLTLSKEITRGLVFESALEYYRRESDLALGSSGSSRYADFDFRIISAGLRLDLDAANLRAQRRAVAMGGEHAQHQGMHAEHSTSAGVMFGHLLPNAGDFMLAYRHAFSRQVGSLLAGSQGVSDAEVVSQGCRALTQCRYVPTYMNMKMHMIELMYAPTPALTLMLMPQFMDMDMNLRELVGRPAAVPGVHEHTGSGGHTSGGIGDTVIAGLFQLRETSSHSLHAGLGVSAPTGKVDQELRRMFRIDGGLMHFDMQTGSGTWDMLPSLTYTGHGERWQWGAQLSGVLRLESRNESGYRLGNSAQVSSWTTYGWLSGMSATLRGVYTQRSAIQGDFDDFNAQIGPMDFPRNQGGRFVDLGVGLSYTIPAGRLAGNSLALEWLEPVHEDVNGFQLARRGAVNASWQFAF